VRNNAEDWKSSWIRSILRSTEGRSSPTRRTRNRIRSVSIRTTARAIGISRKVSIHDTDATCVGSTGARGYVADGGIFDPLRSNRFESNTYAVPDPAGHWWTWVEGPFLAGLATEPWARHDGVGHDCELLADLRAVTLLRRRRRR